MLFELNVRSVTWKQFCEADDCEQRAIDAIDLIFGDVKVNAGNYCLKDRHRVLGVLSSYASPSPTQELLAALIAKALFTDGGGERAERLVLMKDLNHPLGGWNEAAATAQIFKVLKENSPDVETPA